MAAVQEKGTNGDFSQGNAALYHEYLLKHPRWVLVTNSILIAIAIVFWAAMDVVVFHGAIGAGLTDAYGNSTVTDPMTLWAQALLSAAGFASMPFVARSSFPNWFKGFWPWVVVLSVAYVLAKAHIGEAEDIFAGLNAGGTFGSAGGSEASMYGKLLDVAVYCAIRMVPGMFLKLAIDAAFSVKEKWSTHNEAVRHLADYQDVAREENELTKQEKVVERIETEQNRILHDILNNAIENAYQTPIIERIREIEKELDPAIARSAQDTATLHAEKDALEQRLQESQALTVP
jgi:hypothetical protein